MGTLHSQQGGSCCGNAGEGLPHSWILMVTSTVSTWHGWAVGGRRGLVAVFVSGTTLLCWLVLASFLRWLDQVGSLCWTRSGLLAWVLPTSHQKHSVLALLPKSSLQKVCIFVEIHKNDCSGTQPVLTCALPCYTASNTGGKCFQCSLGVRIGCTHSHANAVIPQSHIIIQGIKHHLPIITCQNIPCSLNGALQQRSLSITNSCML